MGIYTHFVFDATLSKNTPIEVIDYLKYRLTASDTVDLDQAPYNSHPFFKCYRWDFILTWHDCNGNGQKSYATDTENGLVIHIDTMLKNYCRSIEWFLLFIAPYIDTSFDCLKVQDVDDVDDSQQDIRNLISFIQTKLSQIEPSLELLGFRT